uniref:CD247 molecule n=1 Tax=Chrysemys picta bellii TaxID=8478 RepID=A0A8C3FEI4_CHRPI
MKWKGIVISAVLQAQLPITDAAPVPGLTDPRLCYILDGILFIYAVIITALFLKAKFSKAPESPALQGQNDVYNKLSRTTRDEYDVLGTKKRGSDLEMGGRNQQRRKKSSQDTVYTVSKLRNCRVLKAVFDTHSLPLPQQCLCADVVGQVLDMFPMLTPFPKMS